MVETESQVSLSDSDVVERVRAGESGLFELLMRRYNQRLFRLIRSVHADDLEAEDILQDTWLKHSNTWPSLREDPASQPG